MSENLQNAIEEMEVQLQIKLDEAAELKKAINTLCNVMGKEPIYTDVEPERVAGKGGPIRPDLYYGKGFATAVREYLENVKQAVLPEDILKALVQGGFDFAAVGWSDKNRLRNLSISLTKNTNAFRKLPNGMIGLESWYDKVPLKRKLRKRDHSEDEGLEEQQKLLGDGAK